MQIEEAFRDLKSTRFGLSLELHHTYQLERLQVLLLIATLALMVAWIIGKATQRTGQHRHYQANTVRDRVVLSTIFLGLKVVNDPRVSLRFADVIAAINSLHETHRNTGRMAHVEHIFVGIPQALTPLLRRGFQVASAWASVC